MESITATQLKNSPGDILRRVGRGEKVLVTRRGKPCAVISPVTDEQLDAAEVRPYEEAWKDIETALGSTNARHKNWEDAISWSRRRP
jgi:prevent-host-death family protein